MKKNKKNLVGLTFIEMIMAISMFTIGIAGFTLLFIKTWSINSYTIEMGRSSMIASQGVNKIVNYLRRTKQGDNGAYAIQSANGNDLIVFCDYNKDEVTERIHLYKSGQNILMGVTVPTDTIPKTYPSGDQTIITITSYVVNDAGSPIFSFYNADYPADSVNNPMTTPASVADIRLVKINLIINSNPTRFQNNIDLQSFVEMRNLNDYNQID